MKNLCLILMAASALSLLLAASMGLDLIKTDLLNVGGTGFCVFSSACSLLAIALHLLKPFEGKSAGA